MSPDSTASILVVDDIPANLRMLSHVLKGRGYRVRAVPSGALALMAARKQTPDLVLMDINMPGMNGFDCCRLLKQQPGFVDVPVLFLSARSEAVDKVAAFEAGGVDFVSKPIELEELTARIDAHLEMRRLRVELRTRNHELALSLEREREMERRRDNLVHMVAHDMRSPLSVISLSLELAQSDGPPDVNLKTAMRGAMTLQSMIDNLLEVSRLEAGPIPLNLSPCALTELARRTISSLARAPNRLIPIDGPMVHVRADEALLKRIIANLVTNALKYTPKDSQITLTVERLETTARLVVSDDGPGVPASHHAQIFDKFGQAPDPRALDAQEGRRSTGLGLTFCKLATEAMGGQIGIESVMGEGSAFWVLLPLA